MTEPSRRSLTRRTFLAAGASLPLLAATPAWAKANFPDPGNHTPTNAIRSYADMITHLQKLQRTARNPLQVNTLRQLGISPGVSEAGRDLYIAKVGNGPRPIWLQGRIHGNEPFGTESLLAVLSTLSSSGDPSTRAILDSFTIHVAPLYNPDGSERNIRHTVLEDGTLVDLNRDWAPDRFLAAESLAYYTYWTQVKPAYGLDIHHQGLKREADGDPISMSLGISLAPGGPTLPGVLGGAYDEFTRKMQGHVYESLKGYGYVNIDRYSVGTLEIDIKGGVASAVMIGLNYQNLNPTGHSHPMVFFETSGNTSAGSIGQKARGKAIKQNVHGTLELLLGLANGDVARTDPNIWWNIPHVNYTGYLTDTGEIPR